MNSLLFGEYFGFIFGIILGFCLFNIAFYLIDNAFLGGKYFKRLFNPHFEMYRIAVVSHALDLEWYSINQGYKHVLDGYAQWYFTKRSAVKAVKAIEKSKHYDKTMITLEIVRDIRSDKVSERLSQKAKA